MKYRILPEKKIELLHLLFDLEGVSLNPYLNQLKQISVTLDYPEMVVCESTAFIYLYTKPQGFNSKLTIINDKVLELPFGSCRLILLNVGEIKADPLLHFDFLAICDIDKIEDHIKEVQDFYCKIYSSTALNFTKKVHPKKEHEKC